MMKQKSNNNEQRVPHYTIRNEVLRKIRRSSRLMTGETLDLSNTCKLIFIWAPTNVSKVGVCIHLIGLGARFPTA